MLVDKIRALVPFLRKFSHDTAGATAILFSFSTVVLTGSIAFGVDAANWYQTDRRLQTASDMAALAAASDQRLQNVFEYGGETLLDIANNELVRNGVEPTRLSSVVVNSPPASGAFSSDPNAVEIITTQDVQIFFAGAFVNGTPQAGARAVARSFMSGNYCILTLHPSQRGAVTFTGSSSSFLGCGIASNSTASDSVLASGGSTVQTTIVTAVGGISDNGNIQTPVNLQPYSNPIVDPYSDLAVPPPAPCDYSNVSASGNATLSPGVYCGNLRVNGNVTFDPGTYVLDGGDFVINAGADVFGEDVTFIFTNSTNISNIGRPRFNGTATIDFDASSSGDYAGILFFQDPAAPDTVGSNVATWLLNGTASSSFEGVIYAPKTEVNLSGNASFANGCIHVVAGAVTINGNFTVNQQCTDPNLRDIESIVVTLVE